MKKLFVTLVLAALAGPTFAQMTLEQIEGLITSDPKAAQKEALKFFKKNKKNTDAVLDLATLFVQAKDYVSAEDFAQKALAVNPKSAKVHIFLGDLRYLQDDGGAAAGEYEQAVNADPTDTLGYVKYAGVYKDKFADQAKQMLERMGQNCPGVNVKRLIADMYYRGNHLKEAANAYNECDINTLNVYDLANYVFSLTFGASDFSKSYEVCSQAATKYPDNSTFKRFSIYNLADLNRFEEAAPIADAFFADESIDKQFLDYIYYGHILKAMKKNEEALVAFQKGYELNDTRIDAFSSMAEIYNEMGEYSKAVENYKQFYDKTNDKTYSMMNTLGNYYYDLADSYNKAGNADEATATAQEADKYYASAIERMPNYFMNYVYRGRNAMLIDKSVALEYFNKSLEVANGTAPENVVNLINLYISKCTTDNNN